MFFILFGGGVLWGVRREVRGSAGMSFLEVASSAQ